MQHLNVFASLQHINRESYYGAGMDPNAYGQTGPRSFYLGVKLSY